MPAWILKILQYIPGIGALIDKFTGNSARVEEIKAETEHDDIKGFHKTGRISAAHMWKYAKVFIAVIVACAFCLTPFFPGAGENAVSLMGAAISAIKDLFTVIM